MSRKHVLESLLFEDDSYTAAVFDQPFALPFSVSARCPYEFDACTIGDVVDYLMLPRSRVFRYQRAPLAWNVKAHAVNINGDDSEYQRDAALDDLWRQHLERDDSAGAAVYEMAFADAQSYYRAEWTSYPGDDQGDWNFCFDGRSGGWLVLERWREFRFYGARGAWPAAFQVEYLATFVALLVHEHQQGGTRADYLAAFYVGMVCADSDFTSAKASANVTAAYSRFRQDWEETRAHQDTLRKSIAVEMFRAARQEARSYGFAISNPETMDACAATLALVDLSKESAS